MDAKLPAQYPPDALIGSTLPNFNPSIEGHRHDICKLVTFYNQAFDIIPNDNLATRIIKLRGLGSCLNSFLLYCSASSSPDASIYNAER